MYVYTVYTTGWSIFSLAIYQILYSVFFWLLESVFF